MNDGAAILEFLSVQNFVLLKMNKNGILWSKYVSLSSKTTSPFILDLVSFGKYLLGSLKNI